MRSGSGMPDRSRIQKSSARARPRQGCSADSQHRMYKLISSDLRWHTPHRPEQNNKLPYQRSLPNAEKLLIFQPSGENLFLSKSEEHATELQQLLRISNAILCLTKTTHNT